jgi:hypothetical protein
MSADSTAIGCGSLLRNAFCSVAECQMAVWPSSDTFSEIASSRLRRV